MKDSTGGRSEAGVDEIEVQPDDVPEFTDGNSNGVGDGDGEVLESTVVRSPPSRKPV